MCGRYYVDDGIMQEIRRLVRDAERTVQTREAGDICPSRYAPVICRRDDRMSAEDMRWGFPGYQQKGLLINARAETVLEKKTFRDSVLFRRCILPARHFYEWNAKKEKATCFQEGMPVLYMAGCYHLLENEKRFVVITTRANEKLSVVHPRMPLLLEEKELEGWLWDEEQAKTLLCKEPAAAVYQMEFEQMNLFSCN